MAANHTLEDYKAQVESLKAELKATRSSIANTPKRTKTDEMIVFDTVKMQVQVTNLYPASLPGFFEVKTYLLANDETYIGLLRDSKQLITRRVTTMRDGSTQENIQLSLIAYLSTLLKDVHGVEHVRVTDVQEGVNDYFTLTVEIGSRFGVAFIVDEAVNGYRLKVVPMN